MSSNQPNETTSSSVIRPSRASICGRPTVSTVPAPGGVRGVPMSNPGRGSSRLSKARRPPPPSNIRGKSYSDYETNLMLDIVEEILPHGQEMWVRCAESYQSRVETGYEVRDADSLRAKFKALRLVKKPTGDPHCPPNVIRA